MTGWRPVRSLLAAIFLAMAGSGFVATLIALRLQQAGAAPITIGWMGTAYFIGLGLGSLLAFRVIGRVGHIRAFTVFVSLFSASLLAYALYGHPIFWVGLRLLDGLCMAGIFVCLESWLNDRAPAAGRGGILALYMIALYIGQAAGQPILTLAAPDAPLPLAAGSILISLAVLPIALTRMPRPPLPQGGAMGLRALYAASPLGVAGALATGVMLRAFYALGGLFTAGIGMDLSQTSRFMGIAILGGVVLQWPLGLLSDRFDRRRVIIGTLAAALTLALLLILPPWRCRPCCCRRRPCSAAWLSRCSAPAGRPPSRRNSNRRIRSCPVPPPPLPWCWIDRWRTPDRSLHHCATYRDNSGQ